MKDSNSSADMSLTTKIDWFVERDKENNEILVLDETWNRPMTTFFKVRLPPVPKRDNEEFNQQDLKERVDDFLKFLDALWEADPLVVSRRGTEKLKRNRYTQNQHKW